MHVFVCLCVWGVCARACLYVYVHVCLYVRAGMHARVCICICVFVRVSRACFIICERICAVTETANALRGLRVCEEWRGGFIAFYKQQEQRGTTTMKIVVLFPMKKSNGPTKLFYAMLNEWGEFTRGDKKEVKKKKGDELSELIDQSNSCHQSSLISSENHELSLSFFFFSLQRFQVG